MSAIDPYLTALREGDATALLLRGGSEPCWRVEGELVPNGDPLPEGAGFNMMLQELLDLGRLPDLDEIGTSEQIDFAFHSGGQRFRVELFHGEGGFQAAIRRIPAGVPAIERVGLSEQVRRMATQRAGLVFVCGPARSGKTTTIAALLQSINSERPAFIVSVERSVEYVLEPDSAVVHQIQVGVDTPSHASGLRAALSTGAGVIAASDLPDSESAWLALSAADRGALVVVGMNATGPVDCVERFLELLPKAQSAMHRCMVAQNLRMVLYQVLLPARSGGLVPAHEILTVTRAVHAHLREGRTHELHAVLQGAGRGAGQRSLDDSLEELIKTGVVEREEALRRARQRGPLEQKTALSDRLA